MNDQIEKYTHIIHTLDIPKDVSFDDFRGLVLGNIVSVDSRLETLYVNNEGGRTVKTSNLRFRIGDLLEAILEKAANIISANPIAIILNVIQFIKEVLKFSDISVSKNDAKLLMALWLIGREKPENIWPTNEDVREFFKNEMTEEEVENSLENLKSLWSIKRMDDGQIQIVEEIEFPNSE